MMKSKRWIPLVVSLAAASALFAVPQQASAKDDFGRIVQHIETQYHVHRQHRFALGLAGFVVKFYHFAGVKNFKGALFENQRFLNAGSDTRFDEIVRTAMDSGWQPMVQSWDRRTGSKTYIYAEDLGRDMKVLVVNLEPNEAVVIQVKVNPEKLSNFVREASAGHNHRNYPTPHEDAQPAKEQSVELAESTQTWDGLCLFQQEPR